MALFNNKYRVETTRLKQRDYASEAYYFITICTKDKKHFFGVVKDDQMLLNDAGLIVHNEWLQTPVVRPDMNITLDEFRVMPNHFHAIIHIGENDFNMEERHNGFGRQSKNLAAIIRGFKATVTRRLKENNALFGWQECYHDHIIRNEQSYNVIKRYIINNPANWKIDRYNNPPPQ